MVGGVVYLLVLVDFSTRLGRSALALGYASKFFELQADAFADGDLHVPSGSLGIEGFVVDGRTYLYFGPWPALLRMPVLATTHEFDGELTVASMALGWLLFAVMFVRLVWLVRRLVVGDRPVSRTHAVLGGLLIAAGLGGTTLTFDASLPWAYHEVYVWQTAFVTGAAYWMVRVALEPTATRAVGWLFLCALGAALTRTTGGWAVAITVVGLALWVRYGRSYDGRRTGWGRVLLAGAVPLAIGIAYNYARFQHPFMFPLQDQVWTDLNQHRRDALAANGGSLTGLQFFTTSLFTYFTPTGIRFVDYFPWVTFPAEPARGLHGAVIDQSYRTGSVTAFMPLLLLLSIIGFVRLLLPTRRHPRGQDLRVLRPPAIATVLMTGGVMAYGYLATRYTTEFVPGLLVLGTVGLWAGLGRVERWRRPPKTAVLGLVALGVAWSLAAWTAVGFATSAFTWRGERLERYLALQERWSGGPGSPVADLVVTGDGLPPEDAPPDTIYVRGDCDGLYVATGDDYSRWAAVEERASVVEVSFPRRVPTRTIRLFTIEGPTRERTVRLEVQRNGFARVAVADEDGAYAGQWWEITPDSSVRVGLRLDPGLSFLEVGSTPGGFVGWVSTIEFRDSDGVAAYSTVTPRYDEPTDVAGMQVQPRTGLTPPFCAGFAQRQGIELP